VLADLVIKRQPHSPVIASAAKQSRLPSRLWIASLR